MEDKIEILHHLKRYHTYFWVVNGKQADESKENERALYLEYKKLEKLLNKLSNEIAQEK